MRHELNQSTARAEPFDMRLDKLNANRFLSRKPTCTCMLTIRKSATKIRLKNSHHCLAHKLFLMADNKLRSTAKVAYRINRTDISGALTVGIIRHEMKIALITMLTTWDVPYSLTL